MKRIALILMIGFCAKMLYAQGSLHVTSGAYINTNGSSWINLDSMNVINDGSILLSNSNNTFKVTGNTFTTLTGVGITQLNNFTNNNIRGTFTLVQLLSVYNQLTLISGLINANGNLTLKSNALNTARVAPITSGRIFGNVTVERYISNRRAWRLLAIPFISSPQTIKDAWMEGAANAASNPSPGFGTHITTFTGDPNASNYDAQKPASSIRVYSGDNFNSDALHTPDVLNSINGNDSYFLFIRGDRSIDRTSTNTASSTILRVKGTINQGGISVSPSGTNFSLIANPYPSPIDFDAIKAIAANSSINTFYVWDATLGVVGQYRAISISGSGPNYTYTATPGATDNNWRFIESGTAFMVPGSTSMSFTENTKSSGTPPSSMFRTTPSPNNETELVINLYTINSDNTTTLDDGVREIFGNNYSAAVDNNDAKKITGFDLNLGIISNNEVLAIEKRSLPSPNDIISLKLWNTTPGNYQFEVQPINFYFSTKFIYLRDTYLNTYTPLSASNNTTVGFTVTTDPASSGENRFSILFAKTVIAPGKFLLLVYPNPAENGSIKLLLNNMPKGLYNIRLLNSLGQTILRKQINHAEGTSAEIINVNTIKGAYILEVITPGNGKFTQKVIIN